MMTWMRERELKFLGDCARLSPRVGTIVELGVYQGATLAVLCQAAGEQRVVGIDNWKMQEHGPNTARLTKAVLNQAGYKPRIVTGESHKVPVGLGPVGMLFIDTEHTRAHLYRELEAWLPQLLPGALVVMHDYDNPDFPEMKPAIDEYFTPPTWDPLGRQLLLIAFRLCPAHRGPSAQAQPEGYRL